MTAFDDFLWAIGQQESGGNYSVINAGSGALGKYQIMPSNVPYWSQKYLGVTWSAQSFLNDPTKQEALARAVLGDLYAKYGPRGAAAAWYSGNPALANNYSPQNGGPSIGGYVDQVLARVPGADAFAQYVQGSGSDAVPTVVHDNTTKASKPQDKPTAGDTSGMGPVTSPGAGKVDGTYTDPNGAPQDAGVGAATGNGAEAAGGEGAQAVVDNSALAPHDGLGPIIPSSSATTAPGTSIDGSGRNLALNAAQKWLGTPYVWGGGNYDGPSGDGTVGFDCSGLVQYALAQAGIRMPRLSYDQLAVGQHTSLSNLQPGDLVGFGDGGHLALYLGNNQIIEAPKTGSNVRIRSLGGGEDAWGVSLANLYQ